MKQFQYTSLESLMSVVRDFLPSMEQYIDEGKVIGTVLLCNDKLGINARQIKETLLQVRDYNVLLPKDFQKVIYVAGLQVHSFGLAQYTDPFDNSLDFTDSTTVQMVPYVEGCIGKCNRIIKKKAGQIAYSFSNWIELSLSNRSYVHTDSLCINRKIKGQYTIDIDDGQINTPFREGELYMMYHASMVDETGQIQVVFDPLVFPWYKWMVIEEILIQMAFNSDQDVASKLKLAKEERKLAWLDAWNFTQEQTYKEAVDYQKKKEWEFYKQYFSGY